MAHSARQNDSFGKVKWAVLKCKMGHSASDKNVKKIQVLCFQRFIKLSNFAYLRPQDFNFRIIDSQSTFFDFLSKEFRTVSAAYSQRQQGLSRDAATTFFFIPVTPLHPSWNMQTSMISHSSDRYILSHSRDTSLSIQRRLQSDNWSIAVRLKPPSLFRSS